MRISDWSSDVCSSDLQCRPHRPIEDVIAIAPAACRVTCVETFQHRLCPQHRHADRQVGTGAQDPATHVALRLGIEMHDLAATMRSEEHTSELQSLMRISYAVFCLKKKNKHNKNQ